MGAFSWECETLKHYTFQMKGPDSQWTQQNSPNVKNKHSIWLCSYSAKSVAYCKR